MSRSRTVGRSVAWPSLLDSGVGGLRQQLSWCCQDQIGPLQAGLLRQPADPGQLLPPLRPATFALCGPVAAVCSFGAVLELHGANESFLNGLRPRVPEGVRAVAPQATVEPRPADAQLLGLGPAPPILSAQRHPFRPGRDAWVCSGAILRRCSCVCARAHRPACAHRAPRRALCGRLGLLRGGRRCRRGSRVRRRAASRARGT